MRAAILAGRITVVRSGVGYVEDGDEVLDIVLWRLATGQTALGAKKTFTAFVFRLKEKLPGNPA